MNLILYLNLLIATQHNKFYQYITNIKGQDKFPTQMFYDNQHACTDQEKAQLFNNYFYSVFSTVSISQQASNVYKYWHIT